MSKLTVGVVRGGPSSEYDVSLKTGATVLKHVPDKYRAKDIFISRDGAWHIDGLTRTPERILRHIDVVFNALHGEYGEDGKIQKILDSHSKPYTGSGSLASALGMNKVLTKRVLHQHGIRTPRHIVVRKGDDLDELRRHLFLNFLLPSVVKPAASGSSVGVSLVKNYNHFPEAIEHAYQFGEAVLIEEYIPGKEATCGVVEHFRDEHIYSLLPVEIVKPAHKDFFDYEAKYAGITAEHCPGNFTEEEKVQLQHLAQEVHKLLGLRHYSRTDFIVHPRRGVFVLETNTLPGLTEESLLPKSLEAVGSTLSHFIDHLITLALHQPHLHQPHLQQHA